MVGSVYWLSQTYKPDPNVYAWSFNTQAGFQGTYNQSTQLYAMAVTPGDVLLAPVPEPETYMMLLLGLGAVGALSRRRARSMGDWPKWRQYRDMTPLG